MKPAYKLGLVLLPTVLLGNWLGQAFGHACDIAYGPLLPHPLDSAMAGAVGTLLGFAFGFAIWRAVDASQRRWLMWLTVPGYTMIGLVLGDAAGWVSDKLGWSVSVQYWGAAIGGVAGCLLGYAAGRVIAAQSAGNSDETAWRRS